MNRFEWLSTAARRATIALTMAAALALLPGPARAQSTALPDDPGTRSETATSNKAVLPSPSDQVYVRPTEKTEATNYLFDAFGPYPVVGAAVTAGINQFSNSPPEWGQGAAGYFSRVGSNYGIAAAAITARYGLAQALREDTLYYRCECTGVWPRARYAALSTFTARRGRDGHRVFSLPALIAPYAGTMTAVYGWYPNRYGAKDAFRMGNYSLLAYVGGNIGLEFFYSGPHSLLARMHLNNLHAAPDPGPNHPDAVRPDPAQPAAGEPAPNQPATKQPGPNQ
jgi:hypothetical protein